MAVTLNISVSDDQAAWVRAQKEKGDYASASDVIRDLIRRERAKEQARWEAEFEHMDKRDGAPGPEPVAEIVRATKQVRKVLLERYEAKGGN